MGWWWKKGRRWNPVPAHSLLFSKSTKGAAKLNVPIRRTNRWQQYYMPSQHTYCGRVWNLIQACDVQSSDENRACFCISLWSENIFRQNMHLKFSVVNVVESTRNAFSKQVISSMQQSVDEITERLFKKAVPIHFVNYFTTNNILCT